jgi:hypothetical protein
LHTEAPAAEGGNCAVDCDRAPMKRGAVRRAEDCGSFGVGFDVITLYNCDYKLDLTLLDAEGSSEPDTITANPSFIE